MRFWADLLCLRAFQIEVAKRGKIFHSPERSVASPDAAVLNIMTLRKSKTTSCWRLRKMAPYTISHLPFQYRYSLDLENSFNVHFGLRVVLASRATSSQSDTEFPPTLEKITSIAQHVATSRPRRCLTDPILDDKRRCQIADHHIYFLAS